jgi:hypothetical protein
VRGSAYERLEREIVWARRLARAQERKRCGPLRSRADLAMLRTQLALIRLERALWRKYRPDQPACRRAATARAGGGRTENRTMQNQAPAFGSHEFSLQLT